MLRDFVPCLMRFEVEDDIFGDHDEMAVNEDGAGAGEIAPTRRLTSLSSMREDVWGEGGKGWGG